MKRILAKGFTLAELMVALGISAVIILSIMHAQKMSTQNTNKVNDVSELNSLMQTLTTELSRTETCQANFGGKPTTQASIGQIVNKSNMPFLVSNTDYGSVIRTEMKIGGISTTLVGNKMNLIVQYTLHPGSSSSVLQSFAIPINISLAGDGTIKSCYSDVQGLLIQAVKNACSGSPQSAISTARYVLAVGTGIGSCEHEITMFNNGTNTPANQVNLTGTGSYLCTGGQVLRQVMLTGNPGTLTFVCGTVNATNSCGPWGYIDAFNADGSVHCQDVRNFFTTSSGFMALQNGTYKTINIDCGAGLILQYIKSDGTPYCVNPRVNGGCGVNQRVVSVDAVGNPTCDYSYQNPTCTAGSFITQIDAAGTVQCKSGSTTCPSNAYAITGTNGTADVTCTLVP